MRRRGLSMAGDLGPRLHELPDVWRHRSGGAPGRAARRASRCRLRRRAVVGSRAEDVPRDAGLRRIRRQRRIRRRPCGECRI